MAGSGDREALAVRTPDGEQVALALARHLAGTALVGGVGMPASRMSLIVTAIGRVVSPLARARVVSIV